MHQSRWGYHPISQEQYLRLKTLHKEVWEEYRLLCAAHRTYRKENQNWGDNPPDVSQLKYIQDGCGWFPIYEKVDGETKRRVIHVEKEGPDRFHSLKPIAGWIVDELRNARTPKETPEEVVPCRSEVLALLHSGSSTLSAMSSQSMSSSSS